MAHKQSLRFGLVLLTALALAGCVMAPGGYYGRYHGNDGDHGYANGYGHDYGHDNGYHHGGQVTYTQPAPQENMWHR